jgi:hypothetical protein
LDTVPWTGDGCFEYGTPQRCGTKGSTSAYETVFGTKYGFSEKTCDHEELRQCETVSERIRLVDSPRFNKMARKYFEYDSDGEVIPKKLPTPKKLPSKSLKHPPNEVSALKNPPNIKNDESEDEAPKKSAESSKIIAPPIKDDESVVMLDEAEEKLQPAPIEANMYTMTEAWDHSVVKPQMINGKSYRMIYPFLRCQCVVNFGSQSIAVGEPNYYHDLRYSKN